MSEFKKPTLQNHSIERIMKTREKKLKKNPELLNRSIDKNKKIKKADRLARMQKIMKEANDKLKKLKQDEDEEVVTDEEDFGLSFTPLDI